MADDEPDPDDPGDRHHVLLADGRRVEVAGEPLLLRRRLDGGARDGPAAQRLCHSRETTPHRSIARPIHLRDRPTVCVTVRRGRADRGPRRRGRAPRAGRSTCASPRVDGPYGDCPRTRRRCERGSPSTASCTGTRRDRLACFGSKRHVRHVSLILLMYAPPEAYGLVAIMPPSANRAIPITLGNITQSAPSTKLARIHVGHRPRVDAGRERQVAEHHQPFDVMRVPVIVDVADHVGDAGHLGGRLRR